MPAFYFALKQRLFFHLPHYYPKLIELALINCSWRRHHEVFSFSCLSKRNYFTNIWLVLKEHHQTVKPPSDTSMRWCPRS